MLDVSLEKSGTLEYLENEAPPTDRKRHGTCMILRVLLYEDIGNS
jgi:hypothetical protein